MVKTPLPEISLGAQVDYRFSRGRRQRNESAGRARPVKVRGRNTVPRCTSGKHPAKDLNRLSLRIKNPSHTTQ